jgi:zinc protease
MKKIQIFFIAALVLLVSSTFAQTDLKQELPRDPDVVYGVLDNGMTYYIRHNETPKNRAELTIITRAGSIQENESQRGLAHFCEHMSFNGTKNFPKHKLVDFLERTGMKFGADVNAYTIFDETVYGITVPLDSANFLEKGLLVLHDWSGFATMEKEEIDAERGVIHEEWRMHQGAQFRLQDTLFNLIFKDSKYAVRSTIGLMSVVDECPYDTLRQFYKDWYKPERQAVIIVGDFDAKEVEAKIKKLFNDIPKSTNSRKYVQEQIPDNEKPLIAVLTDKEMAQTAVQMFVKHPRFIMKTVEDYRTSMVHNLYNQMISDRLKELTQTDNPPFVYGAAGYGEFIGPLDAYMSIAATKADGILAGAQALFEENYRIIQHGFTATELERAKKSLMKSVEKQYNNRDKQKSSAYVDEYKGNFLMSHTPIPGMEKEYGYYKEFLNGISLEEVNKLASGWFTEKNMVLIAMAPEKEGFVAPTAKEIEDLLHATKAKKLEPYVDKVATRPLFEDAKLITKTGKITSEKEIDTFGAKELILDNGIKIIVKPTENKDDEILMTSYSKGGYSVYGQEDDISSKIATDIIMESGLNGFDKTELDKLLSDKNANVYPYINQLSEGINGNSSIEDFETMLQLTNLYFTKPRYDKTAYASYMSRMKSALEDKSLSPDNAFRDSIAATLSSHNKRARPMSAKLLDEADYKRVHKIYRERFEDPSSFTFFFVGNIDLEKAKPLFEKYLGSLDNISKDETWKDLGIDYPKGKVDVKAIKGTEPKSIVLIQLNHDFDYNQKDRVIIKLLGKSLSISLIDTVREKYGIVYSIGAYPNYEKLPTASASMSVYFPCGPDNIEQATKETFEIFNDVIANGVSEVNLNKAKQQLLKEYETDLKENNYWLRTMKNYYFYDISLKEFDAYSKLVSSISEKDIKKAAKKYLNDDNYIRVSLVPEK